MSAVPVAESNSLPSLRLWPGIAAVSLQWPMRYLLPIIEPDAYPIAALGGILFWLVVLVWWVFFSRASKLERGLGFAFVVLGMIGTAVASDVSIRTGMMGLLIPFYAAPLTSMALVLWAVFGRRIEGGLRPLTMAAAIAASCVGLTLLRTDGITGMGGSQFHWRWSQTAEEALLAHSAEEKKSETSELAVDKGAMGESPWPGFRGPDRDGVVRGVQIRTDWKASSPETLFRKPVGPGWSSFAIHGSFFFTQEQRGEEEAVSCYELQTGDLVWRHTDSVRFWESNAGAGPRGTPTLHEDRLYTLGGTGILNALNVNDGQVVWTRDTVADTGAAIPEWGISGSPLVIDGMVFVAVSGVLASYGAVDGTPGWQGTGERVGYSSPHPMTIQGVDQLLLMSNVGLSSFDPQEGTVLWEHEWSGDSIVQPAQVDDSGLLASTGMTAGMRRLELEKTSEGWKVETRWTSPRLRPYFNDFVIHQGYAYGLDRGILTCISLEDGQRQWKDGRYGCGQILLFADQDVLLVLGEEGELALVEAQGKEYRELARRDAIEGKTWNHMAFAGDVLLVRNDREMAGLRLLPVDG